MRVAGIDAQWVRPHGGRELAPGEVLMNMSTKRSSPVPDGFTSRFLGGRSDLRIELTRTLQMKRSDLDHYVIEMLDQDTWLDGIRYMLADAGLEGHPWPHFRGEDQVWV